MKVNGYAIRNDKIYCSNGYVQEKPFFDFIFNLRADERHIFFNLSYDVACLLKSIGMPKEGIDALAEDGGVNWKGVLFEYTHEKFFKMETKIPQWTKPRYIIWGDCTGNEYIKKNSKDYDRNPIELAIEAGRVGQAVWDTLLDLFPTCNSIISPINALEKDVISKMDLPTWLNYPEELREGIVDYSLKCCKHNWLSAFKLGSWDKVYDYDISSAYPAEISKLIDTRYGVWEYLKNGMRKCTYGFYKCNVRIPTSVRFSPIMCVVQKGEEVQTFNPTGEWVEYLTRDEILFINNWKLGTVDIIDGYEFVLNETLKYEKCITPFEKLIDRLYVEKENTYGLKRDIIKKAINGLYGKFIETSRGIGKYFNPVWGAYIETPVRLKVAELALKNGIVPIHIAVDGLVSDRELVLPNEEGIGSWKLNLTGPAICMGNTAIAIKGKETGRDFSFQYDRFKQILEENPDSKEYELKTMSPITIPVAYANNEYDKLGELREIKMSWQVGYDEGRVYMPGPKCGKDLLEEVFESYPIDHSFLGLRNVIKGDV